MVLYVWSQIDAEELVEALQRLGRQDHGLEGSDHHLLSRHVRPRPLGHRIRSRGRPQQIETFT